MTVIGVDVMSIFAVPDVYALICAARGDALIARQPCDGIDWLFDDQWSFLGPA